jgi:hypothetical protein
MAKPQTAEEVFLQELEGRLTAFSQFLKEHWNHDDSLELLLLIALGVLVGALNTHQVCQLLGLNESGTYEQVGEVSVYHWHKLLQQTLYDLVIPELQERQGKSEATHSRDGWELAVDDSVIARVATALGYVWKWWSGQAKQVTDGQNIIALLVVVGDLILPLDVRIVSKQGPHVRTKPQIFAEMLDEAERRFGEAGIDIQQFQITGDAAYLEQEVADLCAAMRVAGVFRGKGNYVFTIGRQRQNATAWKQQFASLLKKGWGCEDEVYRVVAQSPTFGKVVLVFYRPKEGKERIEYLIVVGRPLRACEAMRAYHLHHWIEEFWKRQKSVLQVAASALRGRAGALACVGIKILAYVLLTQVCRSLRKWRRFSQLTLHQVVHLCPKFVDMRAFLREHFHGRIPANYGLDKALARL